MFQRLLLMSAEIQMYTAGIVETWKQSLELKEYAFWRFGLNIYDFKKAKLTT